MRWAAGLLGWRITSHTASLTGRSGGGAWRPLGVATWEPRRDSGNHLHAKMKLPAHRAAATRPGADWPARKATDPTTGPINTPRLVAADSHPSALARSVRAIVAATYPSATPLAPPPHPCPER